MNAKARQHRTATLEESTSHRSNIPIILMNMCKVDRPPRQKPRIRRHAFLRRNDSPIRVLVALLVVMEFVHHYSSTKAFAFQVETLKRSSATISTPYQQDVAWLIVGGGIHGVHIAARLLGEADVDPKDLCIVDDNHALLQTWKSRTASTGMKYLRSSAGFHLDLDEDSLRHQFGKKTNILNANGGRKGRKRRRNPKETNVFFANDYERPRLDIFNQHCDSVIEKYNLAERHRKGRVTSVEPNEDFCKVQVAFPNAGDKMTFHAKHVVLALGNDDPSYAEWVDEDDVQQGVVRHLLDMDGFFFKDSTSSTRTRSVAVIGGGITAAHKALELVKTESPMSNYGSKPSVVHLISRHPIMEQQFDTHQDWMMDLAASKRSQDGGGYGKPKRQRLFSDASTTWQERRRIIAQERIPGTVTPAVNRGENGLQYAIESGAIQWHHAEVLETKRINNESGGSGVHVELILSSGETIHVDEILLATGFGKKLPGGKMVQTLIDNFGLTVSDFDGYPIVNQDLSWHPRIFVAGALAELELGPPARNIAGARLAAERIVHSVRAS